ncbi:hypothetical protein D3C72_2410450 [compost metagenome]
MGDVKDVASILANPLWDNALMKAILSCVSMNCFSFWKPSRGATSWMYSFLRVALGSFMAVLFR